jgi:outer membrane protein OmpA-like peptidoglycan-associated protein
MWLCSLIFLTGLLSGCASTEKFPPLERAREAYSNAEANPDVKLNAPVALYEAGEALKKAERAVDNEKKRHLSYLSEKKSEIAVALAEQKKAEKDMALLKEEEKRAILESRRSETEQAKSDAAASALETLAAREEAMTKSREAQDALDRAAMLEAELAKLKAVKTDRGMVLTMGDVLFATGRAELAPGANQTMDYLAAFLNKYMDRKILIEGHTDSVGSDSLNQGLSERRAQSVKAALLGRGVSFDRIDTMGYGESRPVAGNDNAAGRQQNRRVEIVISTPSEPATQTQ